MRKALLPIAGAVAIVVAALGITVSASSHHRPTPTTTTTIVVAGDCKMNGALPDTTCTPGALNPAVTQANIQQTICVKGYTATIRPPLSYTGPLKRKIMGHGSYSVSYNGQQYSDHGYGTTYSASQVELDHLVPLEVGGAPADPHNLWPEPGGVDKITLNVNGQNASSQIKDAFENWSREQLCTGKETLAKAQHDFMTDWLSAYIAAGKPADPYANGSPASNLDD